jgi:uncharacterized protein GlcG (DUF336 family)
MFRNNLSKPLLCAGLLTVWHPANADDTISTRMMTLNLAADIARAAVEDCAGKGYQVSAVVVDRSGTPQVVMRDVYASRFTNDIAERKANAVVMSGVSSADFRKNRADILAEMNEVDGIMVLDGGLPIRAAGSLLGAVGVSGGPGGDKDEACARAGIEKVQDRLDFID